MVSCYVSIFEMNFFDDVFILDFDMQIGDGLVVKVIFCIDFGQVIMSGFDFLLFVVNGWCWVDVEVFVQVFFVMKFQLEVIVCEEEQVCIREVCLEFLGDMKDIVGVEGYYDWQVVVVFFG